MDIESRRKEWDKRGYYKVGEQKFYSKSQAIRACQSSHHGLQFVFNDDVFTAANWKQEPQESLAEIYKQRAQQLRNKYDYLVLSYSSGSDSTNMLQSFLHNNIPVDEIFCYGPFSTTQGKGTLTRDPENNYREIDLVAIPYLQELAKRYNFKVNLYDWSDDMASSYKDADWIWTDVQSRLSPSTVVRNRLHENASHKRIIDQGKKVGFVYGIDKPRVILKDGTYYMAFLDLTMQMGGGPGALLSGQEWEHDEFFYWTPDMPQLLIKQGHLLKNFFDNNPSLKCVVENADRAAWHDSFAEQYFLIVKKLLYPNFNPSIWQTDKIKSLTFNENDNWFINSIDLPSRRYWVEGLKQLENIVDPKWFNAGKISNGFVGSWSQWHPIG